MNRSVKAIGVQICDICREIAFSYDCLNFRNYSLIHGLTDCALRMNIKKTIPKIGVKRRMGFLKIRKPLDLKRKTCLFDIDDYAVFLQDLYSTLQIFFFHEDVVC